jgi:hypothetical protein
LKQIASLFALANDALEQGSSGTAHPTAERLLTKAAVKLQMRSHAATTATTTSNVGTPNNQELLFVKTHDYFRI